jgi:hypothetical protein
VGTATGAVEQGRYVARIVAGAANLKKTLDAKYYYQASLSLVLQDIFRETGEALDVAASDPFVTSFLVPRWARLRGEARLALGQVAKEVGGFWRHTRAGLIAIRKEELWSVVTGDYVETFRDPAQGIVEIAPEAEPFVRPGTTLGTDRVVQVSTTWDARELRQRLTLDDGTGKSRGAGAKFGEAMQRASEAPLNYGQWYPSKVVAQDGDGTVQIYADDPRIRGNGITRVPLKHGLPGLDVKVKAGERVILFFEDGDPKKPAAGLWPDGSSVLEVVQRADERLGFVAPALRYGSLEAAQRAVLGDLLKQWITSAIVSTAMGPAKFAQASITAIDDFLSIKHKLDE